MNIVTEQNNNSHETNSPTAPGPGPWRTSAAKRHLQQLLQNDHDGSIHAMKPDLLYASSELFQQFPLKNFKNKSLSPANS